MLALMIEMLSPCIKYVHFFDFNKFTHCFKLHKSFLQYQVKKNKVFGREKLLVSFKDFKMQGFLTVVTLPKIFLYFLCLKNIN